MDPKYKTPANKPLFDSVAFIIVIFVLIPLVQKKYSLTPFYASFIINNNFNLKKIA